MTPLLSDSEGSKGLAGVDLRGSPIRAFTLLQVLVVLAIVAVLAALLLLTCNRSGPLTRAQGVKDGDAIYKEITDYISGENPIEGIA